MNPTDPLHDLKLLIRSRFGAILLDTEEDERVQGLLRHLADRMGLAFFTWTSAQGLKGGDKDAPVDKTKKPAEALSHIKSSRTFSAIHLFQGLGPSLAEKDVAAGLRECAEELKAGAGAIVVTGHELDIPEGLRPLAASLKLPAVGADDFKLPVPSVEDLKKEPPVEDYRHLLLHTLQDLSARKPVQILVGSQDLNRLLATLRGLTPLEAEKVLTKAIIEEGQLTPEAIRKVAESTKAIVERDGLLEYYPFVEGANGVAGLAALKAWATKRAGCLSAHKKPPEPGSAVLRGVLLVGVPGCGKDLCARVVAQEWGVPLLKVDPSRLYNRDPGQNEKNLQLATRIAGDMAPLVLWIDEVEKALSPAGGAADPGASQPALSSFLSWLEGRKGDVFVVAAAGDIERLAPELAQKGRFDEVFFVDLPAGETRRSVLEIHLKRRSQDPARFDLKVLVEKSEGFSGSEIEQAIVSGLYRASSAGADLSTAGLLEEVSHIQPVSRTRAEKVTKLREWARERTVSAN